MRMLMRAGQAIGDGRLRCVPALGLPDVAAVVRRLELGADALPAQADVEDDLVVIDQVFASSSGFGFHSNGSSGDLRRGLATEPMRSIDSSMAVAPAKERSLRALWSRTAPPLYAASHGFSLRRSRGSGATCSLVSIVVRFMNARRVASPGTQSVR